MRRRDQSSSESCMRIVLKESSSPEGRSVVSSTLPVNPPLTPPRWETRAARLRAGSPPSEGLGVGSLLASRSKRGTRLPERAVAGFTMVEIAISLGVIAIALVAILGVLPTGVRVQRDNREDTILNQEGVFWLETIRSGSKGLDYLTNYVDTITISNVTLAKA